MASKYHDTNTNKGQQMATQTKTAEKKGKRS